MSALQDLREKKRADVLEEAVRLFADHELDARKDGKCPVAERAAIRLLYLQRRLVSTENLLREAYVWVQDVTAYFDEVGDE